MDNDGLKIFGVFDDRNERHCDYVRAADKKLTESWPPRYTMCPSRTSSATNGGKTPRKASGMKNIGMDGSRFLRGPSDSDKIIV
ncbi:MAG: hypothetical protein K5770_03985 [Lachnospiraceae bacterium]|nr:hypothetical protein [Lachnospiraceae bacterium]